MTDQSLTDGEKEAGFITLVILVILFYLFFVVALYLLAISIKKTKSWSIKRIIHCLVPWPILGTFEFTILIFSTSHRYDDRPQISF